MKYLNPLIMGAFAVNVASFAVVGGLQISRNVTSTTSITARQSAVLNIAKHVLSDSCWEYQADNRLKIGDPIITKSSGKLPTGCVYSPQTKQFIEVGYLSGELQAIRIFSIKEVQSAKSQLISNKE
ncbi:MAG: hypothetical protein HC907_14985 [Richelia sp. SM1_7_0]|nr:hypothetical protein [Richelia sp. SM1_7_0]